MRLGLQAQKEVSMLQAKEVLQVICLPTLHSKLLHDVTISVNQNIFEV